MAGTFAAQDRPFLGWGQLVLPPVVAGVSCAVLAWPFAFLAVLFTLGWAWKVCDEIAEWRYTVRWAASLRDEDARPANHFVWKFREAIFVAEVAVIVLAVLVAAMWPWLPTLGPEPRWGNFQRLRVGMTADEVEAVMGPPTQDLDLASLPIPPHLGPADVAAYKKAREVHPRTRVWHAKRRYVFYVYFDPADRLRGKFAHDLED